MLVLLVSSASALLLPVDLSRFIEISPDNACVESHVRDAFFGTDTPTGIALMPASRVGDGLCFNTDCSTPVEYNFHLSGPVWTLFVKHPNGTDVPVLYGDSSGISSRIGLSSCSVYGPVIETMESICESKVSHCFIPIDATRIGVWHDSDRWQITVNTEDTLLFTEPLKKLSVTHRDQFDSKHFNGKLSQISGTLNHEEIHIHGTDNGLPILIVIILTPLLFGLVICAIDWRSQEQM